MDTRESRHPAPLWSSKLPRPVDENDAKLVRTSQSMLPPDPMRSPLDRRCASSVPSSSPSPSPSSHIAFMYSDVSFCRSDECVAENDCVNASDTPPANDVPLARPYSSAATGRLDVRRTRAPTADSGMPEEVMDAEAAKARSIWMGVISGVAVGCRGNTGGGYGVEKPPPAYIGNDSTATTRYTRVNCPTHVNERIHSHTSTRPFT